jgi:hypothetical protein
MKKADELPRIPALSTQEKKELAMQAEKKGDFQRAIELYEQILGVRSAEEYCYNRMMILYRKNKMYKKELATVKRAIAAFEDRMAKLQSSRHLKNPQRITIKKLSDSLVKKLGLEKVETGPVGRWHSRKMAIEKKLKSPAK